MCVACWICGGLAATAEHKYKKSDTVRGHGKGPYKGDGSVSHYCEGKESKVQGPDANVLKYHKSLCAKCNNETTQPFDKAYEQFISWIFKNECNVLRDRKINFETIYSSEWETAQLNLYKYLVKAFGCKIVEAQAPVPLDLINFLRQESFQTGLRIIISVNEIAMLMDKEHYDGLLRGSEFVAWPTVDRSQISHARWDSGVSWLTFEYWYGIVPPDGYEGDIWAADRGDVCLGNKPVTNKIRDLFNSGMSK